MADNFHDIIPPERRSIRNITNSHRRPRRPTTSREDVPSESKLSSASGGAHRARVVRAGRLGIWIAALVVASVLILALSVLFSGSKVVVTPQQRSVVIDGTFESSRTAGTGTLAFDVMTVDGTRSKRVPAAGEERAEERASGKILIFNDFSTAPQRLITNTRFETPDGLIYRINEPAVVPGQTKRDGETIPGSVEVTVYADEPGERYNIGLTDFTIPGFKGAPQFDAMYARSRTAMSGGFSGTRLTANPSDVSAAQAELREQLESELRAEAAVQLPDGFLLFDSAIFVTYEALPTLDRGDEVEIVEKGTLHGILFDKRALAAFVAENTVASFDDDASVVLNEPTSLALTFVNATSTRPWEEDTFLFTLSGNADIVWLFDEKGLTADLAGRSKEALQTVLTGYEGIERAEVTLRPIWRQTFPNDPEKIKIEIEQMPAE